MNRKVKIALGIPSCAPLIPLIMLFMFVIYHAFSIIIGSVFGLKVSTGGNSSLGLLFMHAIFSFIVFSVLSIHLLLFSYILLTFFDKTLDRPSKAGWIIALLFLPMFLIPIYWYERIWKEHEEEPAEEPLWMSLSEYDLTPILR